MVQVTSLSEVAKARDGLLRAARRFLSSASLYVKFSARLEELKTERWLDLDDELAKRYQDNWRRDNPTSWKRIQRIERARASRQARRDVLAEMGLDKSPLPVKASIKASAGAGKTQAIIQAYGEMHRAGQAMSIDFLVPNHKKAAELDFDIKAQGVPSIVVRGRSAVDEASSVPTDMLLQGEEADRMCPRHHQAQIVGAEGESVNELMCKGCPLAQFALPDGTVGLCGYKRQIREIEAVRAVNGIIIYPHAYLYCNPPVTRSKITIVDEDIVKASVQRLTIAERDVVAEGLIEACGDYGTINQVRLTELIEAVWKVLIRKNDREARAMARLFVPMYEELMEHIKNARALLRGKSKVARGGSISELESQFDSSKRRRLNRILCLVREILSAAKLGLPLDGIKLHKVEGKVSVIELLYIRRPKIITEGNVLFMDATLRHVRLATLIGLDAAALPVETFDLSHNLALLHIRDTASMVRLLASHKPDDSRAQEKAKKLRRTIMQSLIDRFGSKRVLLCANKQVEDALRADGMIPDHWELIHYHNLRGLNGYERFDVAVAIGQAIPGMEEIERIASLHSALDGRAVLKMKDWLDEHPDAVPRPDGFVNDSLGEPWHPDEYVRELIEAYHMNEVEQLFGRLRAVGAPAPKEAVIIGHRVPDIYKDAIQRSDDQVELTAFETYAQRELEANGGWVILSPASAWERQKDLWRSSAGCKRSFERAYLRGSAGEHYHLAKYILKGRGGDARVHHLRVMATGWSKSRLVLADRPFHDLDWTSLPGARLVSDDTPVSEPDKITVMVSANGSPATKVMAMAPSGVIVTEKAKPGGQYFRAKEVKVDGIMGLSTALTAIEKNPRAFVIRGAPLPGRNLDYIRRNLKPKRESDGSIAPQSFADASRSWMMVDVDKCNLPLGFEANGDYRAAVDVIMRQMPPPLRDATAHIVLSSSTGTKAEGTVSFHAWYWLDRPLDSWELKRALKALDSDVPLDLATANPIQPHYNAAPVCRNFPDPIAERSWLRQGKVDVVHLEVPEEEEREIRPMSDLERLNAPDRLRDSLLDIGGPDGFQRTILRATRFGAMAIRMQRMEAGTVIAMISEAVLRAPSGGRTADEIDRYAGHEFISDKISWHLQQAG